MVWTASFCIGVKVVEVLDSTMNCVGDIFMSTLDVGDGRLGWGLVVLVFLSSCFDLCRSLGGGVDSIMGMGDIFPLGLVESMLGGRFLVVLGSKMLINANSDSKMGYVWFWMVISSLVKSMVVFICFMVGFEITSGESPVTSLTHI